MKKIFLLVVLFVGYIYANSYRVIKVYTNLDNAPYAYIDKGDIKGVYIDTIKAAIDRMGGYSVEFRDITPRNGLEKLYNNEILAYIVDISKEEKYNQLKLKKMYQLKIKYRNEKKEKLDFSMVFSKKPFLYKDDFSNKFNLAINIMKNSGQIDDILEEYSKHITKQTIQIALHPWSMMVSKELYGNGFFAELLHTIWKNAGYDVEFKIGTPHYGNLLTKWGNTLQFAPSYKDDSKNKFFYFSDPLFALDLNLFYKIENFPSGIKNDLTSYKIGAVAGYYYDNLIKSKNLNIVYFDTEKELYLALIQDNIDMLITNKYLFPDNLLKYTKYLNRYAMYKTDIFRGKNYVYVLFAKNYHKSDYLLRQFNKSFKQIKKNGKLNLVLEKFEIKNDFYNDTFGKVEGERKSSKKPKNIFLFE